MGEIYSSYCEFRFERYWMPGHTHLQVSYIDLSNVPTVGLEYVRALMHIHRAIDPHHGLRMMFGKSLCPARVILVPLGGGLLALLAVDRWD